MTKSEKVCLACGTRVTGEEEGQGGLRLVTFLDFAFVASLAVMAAVVVQPSSLAFLPVELTIQKCLVGTVVLLILRLSASQSVVR